MNTFEKNLKFLKTYDLFGYPISLSFKKKSTYTTICGGILSLIIVSFLLIIFSYSIFKLFNQDYKETTKYITNLGSEYGDLNLNSGNFMVGVKFDNELLNNWTKPFMSVIMYQTTQFRNSTTTWKVKNKLNMTPCTPEHFSGLETEFAQLQLNSALCPAIGSNLSLQGNFQESVFSYLAYNVIACVDNKTCQDNNTIYNTLKKLEKIRFQIFIINSNINELDIENPIKRSIISDIFFLVDPLKDVYRTADIYLTETEVKTDYGYTPTILNEFQTLKNFTYNQEFREQAVYTSTKVNIAEFYFRKSQTKIKYERRLGNILTVLSYLGGIWSSCYFLVYVFVLKYTENSFIANLSNKIYNFPTQKKQKRKKKKNTNSEIGKITERMELSPNSPQSPMKKSVFSNVITKIKEYLSYDRKLHLSFTEMTKIIIKSLIRCKNSDEKSILFEKSEDNLMNDLDIYNILRRLHELEKMKSLLFSDDQQIILNFFPKPSISSSNVPMPRNSVNSANLKSLKRLASKKKKTFLSEQTKFDDINIFKDLIEAWKKLKIDKSSSEINKKLIDTLGEEFSGMIDIDDDVFKDFLEESNNIAKEDQFSNFVKSNKSFFFNKRKTASVSGSPKEKKNEDIKDKLKIEIKNGKKKIVLNKTVLSQMKKQKSAEHGEIDIEFEDLTEKNEDLKMKSSKAIRLLTGV